ncbi:transglycosylase domain-containing protein [Paenibacillus koleovorans]|uniref:transglycosylase domain-containing protein n=1 Tax=Paenibacillus koleovorans TaxID=121608 RepID=UPI000FDC5111|nr:penicillin-binding protein 1A [Paenibacillus koleovorans]
MPKDIDETRPESNHSSRNSGSRSRKKPKKRSLLARLTVLMFSLGLVGLLGLAGMLLYLRQQALPVSTALQNLQLLDIRGDMLVTSAPGQNREFVPLSSVSPYLVKATLSIEDERFYDHFGLDPKGIARAMLVNIESGSTVQGASTITQQLARNLYLTHDRTWSRKLKEAMYAAQLEMQMSKDQILEQYLNQIYYGHSAYGIQAASKMYFHKNARDLTLAESALLAGVPKGPKYYSPYLDPESAKTRQELILDTMVRNGYVSESEARTAKAEVLHYEPRENRTPANAAPYFQDYVRSVAVDRLGISEQEFDEGGLRIYTTLDLKAQQAAEEIVSKHMEGNDELQSALVAIDPRTGYIRAMVGGKSYHDNQFNRAVSGSRQPGSAFKPFVYLTALQQPGFTPITRFKSEPTSFTYDEGRKVYMPSNFNNKYPNTEIDMREAISKSDNIYAVQSIMQVGADKVTQTAKNLGITSSLGSLPSLALGTYPVSPLEMASAYGTLANQGLRIEPTAILRIETPGGRVLYEAKPAKTQVVDPAYTYVLTNLMQSVFDDGGTASRVASTLKRPVAGKTGSTNTDAWMVGFTPELATAVWVGYDRDRTINPIDSYQAAPIFAEFTERVLEAIPPKLFPMPDDVVSVYIDGATGKLATAACMDKARMESFVKGTEPTESCTGQPVTPDTGATDAKSPNDKSWWEDFKRWWHN